MSDTIICENCGAKCAATDTYCKKCSQPLTSAREASRPVMDGVDNGQLREFIGKNADYYIRKFDRSGDKTVFLQFNLAAFLFGHVWLFYRKMYKAAVWYLAITIIFSTLLSVSVSLIFKQDVENFYECREAYQAFHDSGEEDYVAVTDERGATFYEKTPAYKKVYDDLKAAQDKIRVLYAVVTVPPMLLQLVLRLFANCAYKRYVLRKIDTQNAGGTSFKSLFIGLLCYFAASTASGFLLSLIQPLTAFYEAYELLYSFI